MENKKLLLIGGIVGIALLAITAVAVPVYIFLKNRAATNAPPPPPSTDTSTTTPGTLPTALDPNGSSNGELTPQQEALQKEKQFISSYYESITTTYTAQVPATKLPLSDPKAQVVNYRDFSRKLSIDPYLPVLSERGFAVIGNPFGSTAPNWQDAYTNLKNQKLPLLITADTITGTYQDTVAIIYKEIEQQKFYPALWNLLKSLQNQAKTRYEARLQYFGIETDLVTEANRLELAYLTTALQLLKPDVIQVRDSLGVSQQFFTSQEAETYTFTVPAYLRDEVNQEVALITQRAPSAVSPIFLYQQSYAGYNVPAEYRSSEKLKNYYLATSWLREQYFPVFSKADDCPNCLLDEQDHLINFVASLYLTRDLASNQLLKNQWANIYKSIAFFRGLESDLTYLDYQVALEAVLGPNYDLDKTFEADLPQVQQTVEQLQTKIKAVTFLGLLSGRETSTTNLNLRLLRGYYLPETVVFNRLTNAAGGEYLRKTEERAEDYPINACRLQATNTVYRCWPTGLDLFNLLGNQTAADILATSKQSLFANYQTNLNQLKNELRTFDQNTWHDNAYLSLLDALTKTKGQVKEGFPTFMQTAAWSSKSLNTNLGAWVNTHRPITFERVTPEGRSGFQSYFPYGYIEPQVELYSGLLANVRMIKDGFLGLQIVTEADRPLIRLTALETMLEQVLLITTKELRNELLAIEDFNFINGFDHQVENLTGDIKRQNLNNTYQFSTRTNQRNLLLENVNGFNYIVVTYPDPDGRLFFAIGPIFNYQEGQDEGTRKAPWQSALNL